MLQWIKDVLKSFGVVGLVLVWLTLALLPMLVIAHFVIKYW